MTTRNLCAFSGDDDRCPTTGWARGCRGWPQPPKRFVIGSRRSRPKARGVILMPGAAWRRLYSLRSTIRITRRRPRRASPRRRSRRGAVVFDVGLENRVEDS